MAQDRDQAGTCQETRPSEVRYIELGARDGWAEHAIAARELPFGQRAIAHEPALQCVKEGDWSPVVEAFAAQGRNRTTASG